MYANWYTEKARAKDKNTINWEFILRVEPKILQWPGLVVAHRLNQLTESSVARARLGGSVNDP